MVLINVPWSKVSGSTEASTKISTNSNGPSLHMIRKGIQPTPDDKVVEISELMKSIMEPDIVMEQ